MAKSKTKKASLHSRAARRATSPSIDTDKSLKNVKTPLLPGSNIVRHAGSSAGGAKTGAGVSKRGRKSVKTREQRLRLEKAMLRAEIVMDQMGKKKQDSKRKSNVVKDRSGAWDEINGRDKRREKKSQDLLMPTDEAMDNDWEDAGDSDEERMTEQVSKLKMGNSEMSTDTALGKNIPSIDDDDDVIL